jgi:methionyl-tRNA synthetase
MLVRALGSMGRSARYITGTDDHQSHVAAVARLRQVKPVDIAVTEGDAIVATLHAAGIGCDRLVRPLADPGHADRIRELFARVTSSHAVSEQERETAYCAQCELSLHQAFARGFCARCGESSDGEICEACGRPNEARELTGLQCRICGTPAGTRPERALWLDLNLYADQLRDYLQSTYTSPDLQALVERLLAEGLPAYRLSRSSDWGIALGDGQVLDAWADLALTFLDAVRAEFEQDGPGKISLFLGYDNSYFYAVLLPDGLRGRSRRSPAYRVRHQPVPAPGRPEVLHQPGPRGLGRRGAGRGGTGRGTAGLAPKRPGGTPHADHSGVRRPAQAGPAVSQCS